MSHQPNCLLCKTPMLSPALHLGQLPPCNHFQTQAKAHSPVYPLSMQECQTCSLIQLIDLPPIEALIPQVSWIRYNEPDGHLVTVSSSLLSLLKKDECVYGVGPFDQPLLKNLEVLGLQCETLDLLAAEKAAQAEFFPYLETIQARLQPQLLTQVALEKGQANLVVCRYLLEHCRDPLKALEGLRSLISEQGYALIEVPDSTKFLTKEDYSFIWEEHVCYFTEYSFTQLLQQGGFKLIELLKFEGQLEDALVAIVQPGSESTSEALSEKLKFPSLFERYAEAFSKVREAYQQTLAAIKARGGKIAIFGAGHQAIMFMNVLGLNDYIACLIDDDANKQNYFSPGAGLPILSSAVMLEDTEIDTCLLALSPRIETKIQEKCAAFLQRGGKMYSIFPGSKMPGIIPVETGMTVLKSNTREPQACT